MKNIMNMNDEQLGRTLHEADRALDTPPGKSLSGDHLRRLAARRRAVRRGAVAAAMLVVVAGGVSWHVGNQADRPGETTQLATLRGHSEQPKIQDGHRQENLEEIRAEMRRIMLLTQQLRADRELTRARPELLELKRQPLPSEQFDQHIERADLAGVYLADYWSRESSDPMAARDQFQFVVQHFPNTHWGDVAQERLLAIDTEIKGEFK
jgi:hypothetical protein